MTVQVFGASGMLGSAVLRAAQRRSILVRSDQCDLDLVRTSTIHAPVVINCAGLVKQRDYPAYRFMTVNAAGPHRLAAACRNAGARLIHVSTDCVFQGRGPHCECDAPDARDVYARSKLAGEVDAPHLTVRTSFVGFGPRGLIADLLSGKPVTASDKLRWSGHTVDTVADILLDLAARDDITGLLHIPGEEQTRWELAGRLARMLGHGATVLRDDSYVADRRLISDRWAKLGLPELPSFGAQLEGMHRG